MGNCSSNLPVSDKFMAERNALVQEIAYCENLLKKYYDEKTHVDLSNNVSEIKHILNCIPAHVVDKNDIIIKIEKMSGLIGKKIGMTREFYKTGQSVPVTVIKMEKRRIIDVISKKKRGLFNMQDMFSLK